MDGKSGVLGMEKALEKGVSGEEGGKDNYSLVGFAERKGEGSVWGKI